MSKLFNLKNWLTIEDTARHLSLVFDEPVKDYDVLRLGLDGHLKLSINIVNGAAAKKYRVCTLDNVPRHEMPFSNELKILALPVSDGTFLEQEDKILSIRGIYDLVMIGNERLDIEHEYQLLTNGCEVKLICIEGSYIEHPETKVMYELQDCFKNELKSLQDDNNYYPAGGLPKDAVIVVRARAISEFIESISDKKIEKPISDKERETLLVIIAALAKEAKIDISKTSKAGVLIAAITQQLGAPIGATTIETHLKKISQALESRAK
jgi:hypothetical protein